MFMFPNAMATATIPVPTIIHLELSSLAALGGAMVVALLAGALVRVIQRRRHPVDIQVTAPARMRRAA